MSQDKLNDLAERFNRREISLEEYNAGTARVLAEHESASRQARGTPDQMRRPAPDAIAQQIRAGDTAAQARKETSMSGDKDKQEREKQEIRAREQQQRAQVQSQHQHQDTETGREPGSDRETLRQRMTDRDRDGEVDVPGSDPEERGTGHMNPDRLKDEEKQAEEREETARGLREAQARQAANPHVGDDETPQQKRERLDREEQQKAQDSGQQPESRPKAKADADSDKPAKPKTAG